MTSDVPSSKYRTLTSKLGPSAEMADVKYQPGRNPHIGLGRPKSVGMKIITHYTKREPRSQVAVITSAKGKSAPNALKSTLD